MFDRIKKLELLAPIEADILLLGFCYPELVDGQNPNKR
jgi:hypothetical protein